MDCNNLLARLDCAKRLISPRRARGAIAINKLRLVAITPVFQILCASGAPSRDELRYRRIENTTRQLRWAAALLTIVNIILFY